MSSDRIVGIVGGIAPESTIDYYRRIVAGYRGRGGRGYPRIVIDSIDLETMLPMVEGRRLLELVGYLGGEIERLARAGATFGLFASNTPHLVFDELAERSPIPLVSIVEAACRAAKARGLTRLGLLGTRSTMQGSFYPAVFAAAGIAVVAPPQADQEFAHTKYFTELVAGRFLAETRQGFFALIERLRAHEGIDGVILGGTELPLILKDGDLPGLPFLDTTGIHVDEVVTRLLA
jgi:aspartate racemase